MPASRDQLRLRPLLERDAAVISQAFAEIGWHRPVHQYEQYLAEQQQSIRQCWVALLDGRFAAYVTLHWNPLYSGIAGKGVPEIQDLNVLPSYRRQGIATRLLDRAEQSAASRAAVVAVGVGLHPGYNAAQRLYARRGYMPDGLGVTYEDRFVEAGELVRFDDELVLHLTKSLRPNTAATNSLLGFGLRPAEPSARGAEPSARGALDAPARSSVPNTQRSATASRAPRAPEAKPNTAGGVSIGDRRSSPRYT